MSNKSKSNNIIQSDIIAGSKKEQPLKSWKEEINRFTNKSYEEFDIEDDQKRSKEEYMIDLT